MATLKQVKKRARELGAEITDPLYDPGARSYSLEALAPDGFQWSEGGLIGFVCRWFTYDPGDKEAQLDDLLERMSSGLEPEDEE